MNHPHEELPLVDGSGLPTREQWDHEAYKFELAADTGTTRLLSDCVHEAGLAWSETLEVTEFLHEFEEADGTSREDLERD